VGPDVPILCLGHTPPRDFGDAVAADLRLTLYDPADLARGEVRTFVEWLRRAVKAPPAAR
jgi:hypothetical protein